ncbi:hypothetical protein OAH18_00525 [bacterium]|nr:hypothetical protein [bacterium]
MNDIDQSNIEFKRQKRTMWWKSFRGEKQPTSKSFVRAFSLVYPNAMGAIDRGLKARMEQIGVEAGAGKSWRSHKSKTKLVTAAGLAGGVGLGILGIVLPPVGAAIAGGIGIGVGLAAFGGAKLAQAIQNCPPDKIKDELKKVSDHFKKARAAHGKVKSVCHGSLTSLTVPNPNAGADLTLMYTTSTTELGKQLQQWLFHTAKATEHYFCVMNLLEDYWKAAVRDTQKGLRSELADYTMLYAYSTATQLLLDEYSKASAGTEDAWFQTFSAHLAKAPQI